MMNKTILMLSVSCMSFIAGTDLCYAGFNPYGTPPVLSAVMLKSHVSTHTSHLTAGHLSSLEDFAELTLPENSGRDREGFKPSLTLPKSLGRENRGELTKFLGREEKGEKIKLAAACFVTDTTNCSGNEFSGNNADEDDGGVPPGGPGDDYELDNDKRCIEEGYTLTSCPEGYEPYNYCPYDRTYFEKCVSSCPSDYVTCEEPYHGVGEACDGKYASCECTPCGSGYDYTTIPEGYIQDGEACLDCDGKTKYKIKPNPCDGFMDCGNMGPEIGAGTCQSGNETLYDNCKACPYECSLSSCPDNYTCTKEECSGMYCKSGCQPGYDWDAATQSCTEQCAYKCTLDSCPSPFTCDYEECSGKYCKTGCQPGYNWNASMQSCTSQCSSSQWYSENTGQCCSNSYQYDESNCPLSGNYHCSTNTCGGKYTDCKPFLFENEKEDTVVISGITFAPFNNNSLSAETDKCPGFGELVQRAYSSGKFLAIGNYSYNTRYNPVIQAPDKYKFLAECISEKADQACYDLYHKLKSASDGSTIEVNQDMYCGNLPLYAPENTNVTLNGNGHTLIFEKIKGSDFSASENGSLTVNDLNIISSVASGDGNVLYLSNPCGGTYPGVGVTDGTIVNNVTVSTDDGYNIGCGSATVKGTYTCIGQKKNNAVSSLTVLANSTANIKGVKVKGYLYNNATLNIRDGSFADGYAIHPMEDGAVINLCGNTGNIYFDWADGMVVNCKKVTVNSDVDVKAFWDGYGGNKRCIEDGYVTVNVDPSVCDKMNF